jgi:hypothetical protein
VYAVEWLVLEAICATIVGNYAQRLLDLVPDRILHAAIRLDSADRADVHESWHTELAKAREAHKAALVPGLGFAVGRFLSVCRQHHRRRYRPRH